MRFSNPEHEIEIAQSDVGVDENDALAALGERGTEIGGRRRLSDAAFAGGDDDPPRVHEPAAPRSKSSSLS